jgi:NADPH:quinone reductase
VRDATAGIGVDVVLEAASGDVGEESFNLIAPFGRMVVFGARNVHDTISSEKVQQLIHKNQSVIGFNFPFLRREQTAECVPNLSFLQLFTWTVVSLLTRLPRPAHLSARS